MTKAKLILALVSCSALSLGSTFISLSPTNGANEPLTMPALKGFNNTVPDTPSGNLFKVDRSIRSPNGEDTSTASSKEERREQSGNVDAEIYSMVSIVRQGQKTYAVFVNSDNRISLAIGESNPALGLLSSIDGNHALTIRQDGTQQQWQLFPVGGKVGPNEEESTNQEEVTTP